MKNITQFTVLLLLLALCAAGCADGFRLRPHRADKNLDTVALPYHEAAVSNMVLGRAYMAEGRYELARERLLIALSAARDEDLRVALAQDLDAVDRMIRSRR